MKNSGSRDKGMLGNIFLAAVVLLLHVGVIALMTSFVVFLGGLWEYRLWILLATCGLVGSAGYAFYRRAGFHTRQLLAVLRDPAIRGRSLEVTVLGGVASFRLGGGEAGQALGPGSSHGSPREAPEAARVRDLSQLATLFDRGHITAEEFQGLKRGLMAAPAGPAPFPAVQPPSRPAVSSHVQPFARPALACPAAPAPRPGVAQTAAPKPAPLKSAPGRPAAAPGSPVLRLLSGVRGWITR